MSTHKNKPVIKEIPNPKKYPIIPPDMDYRYLDNAEMFPFEPDNLLYSPANAWWLAECSFLVYCHPGFIRMAMELSGFNHFKFFEGSGTECMVCWNNTAILVVFRGTEIKSLSLFKELKTDINTIPVEFEHGGRVHKGFVDGLDEVWNGNDGLHQFLTLLHEKNPQLPLWTSGHSLGGALAALCFARLDWATGLYTFGAPKVGDATFVKHFDKKPVFRVEHGRDPVPMVPPDLPKLSLNFSELGKLIYINHEGEVCFEKPVVTVESEIVKIKDTASEQSERRSNLTPDSFDELLNPTKAKEFVADIGEHISQVKDEWIDYFDSLDKGIGVKIPDHMPIYYCIKLWNKLVSL